MLFDLYEYNQNFKTYPNSIFNLKKRAWIEDFILSNVNYVPSHDYKTAKLYFSYSEFSFTCNFPEDTSMYISKQATPNQATEKFCIGVSHY
jgi:hypothetical protein